MGEELVRRIYMVQPGFVCLPAQPTRLGIVVGSGVALTIYDARRRRGGAGHYLRPTREAGRSTPVYAAPAVVALVNLFLETGSRPPELEAFLYGGASNPDAPGYDPRQSRRNVELGRELLAKLRVPLAGEDVGGRRGRKIVFNTATGESVVAKVAKLRSSDWYPEV